MFIINSSLQGVTGIYQNVLTFVPFNILKFFLTTTTLLRKKNNFKILNSV